MSEMKRSGIELQAPFPGYLTREISKNRLGNKKVNKNEVKILWKTDKKTNEIYEQCKKKKQ